MATLKKTSLFYFTEPIYRQTAIVCFLILLITCFVSISKTNNEFVEVCFMILTIFLVDGLFELLHRETVKRPLVYWELGNYEARKVVMLPRRDLLDYLKENDYSNYSYWCCDKASIKVEGESKNYILLRKGLPYLIGWGLDLPSFIGIHLFHNEAAKYCEKANDFVIDPEFEIVDYSDYIASLNGS